MLKKRQTNHSCHRRKYDLQREGYFTLLLVKTHRINSEADSLTRSTVRYTKFGKQSYCFTKWAGQTCAPLGGDYDLLGPFPGRTASGHGTNSFIHPGHFYSAPSSPLPLRSAPDYSTNTVSEFNAEAHRQLQVKDLPKVPTWRLERELNPRPFG